jgi:hypothetical protein
MARQRGKQKIGWQGPGALRAWLRNAFLFGDAAAGAGEREPAAQAGDTATVVPGGSAEQGAVLLPFPVHGEALMVRLAELLRERVADRNPVQEPFLLTMSPRRASRLAIDHRSSVEFVGSRSEFRFEVDVSPTTNIVIRTHDFDALVEFIVEYVSARLAEPPSLEAAS